MTSVLQEALTEIAIARGGELRPEDVVAVAHNPLSPLHRYFTWEDEKAAVERRLDQARVLIRSVRVTYHRVEASVQTVAWMRNPDPEKLSTEQGYVAVRSLEGDLLMARQAILAELARAEANLRRARDLAIVLGCQAMVAEYMEGLCDVRATIVGD